MMPLSCNMMTLYAPLILLGLLRNHHMHHSPTSDITRSSYDQIKLGINNTVVIIKWPQGAWSLPMILAQHHEYPTTRYPRYHGDHSRITNGTTLGSTGYLITKQWSFHNHHQSFSHHRTRVVIKHIIIIIVDPQCDRHELGPSPRAWLSIDLTHTLHRGSTLYPHHRTHGVTLPFGWTNGIPTKPLHCHDTLPATPTNSPLG